MFPSNGRIGLTIVELLVVIAIVVILLSLATTGVMMARERARLAECQSNFRQIGLALAANEEKLGAFLILPNSAECFQPPFRKHKTTGGFSHLLPYLGFQTVYDQIPPCAYQLGSPEPTQPSVFRCPSDGQDGGLNYRFCSGSKCCSRDQDLPPHYIPYDGVFPDIGTVRASGITDGLSQTIGASERVQASETETFDRSSHIWNLGVTTPLDNTFFLKTCRTPPAEPLHFERRVGRFWGYGWAPMQLYNHVAPPNWAGTDCMSTPWTGSFRASSRHAAGVGTLRMDGSVHFVPDSIDLVLWRSLATRAGQDDLKHVGQ